MAITSEPVSDNKYNANSITARWGVTANEYAIDGKPVDLQDLMVMVSKNRAVAVEGEVSPLSTRIRARNDELDKLGEVLAELTMAQSKFDEDAAWNTLSSKLTESTRKLLTAKFGYSYVDECLFRSTVDGAIQNVKSEIDGLNNEAQLDMSRLQQLVDRRDESYSTATNLMTAISDTRANLIRNL